MIVTSSQITVPLICFTRPEFPSAESFIESYRWAVENGREPWPPESRDEYLALSREFPSHAKRFRPSADDIARLGLPRNYGLPILPFGPEFRERLFATAEVDPQWARAFYLRLQEIAGE